MSLAYWWAESHTRPIHCKPLQATASLSQYTAQTVCIFLGTYCTTRTLCRFFLMLCVYVWGGDLHKYILCIWYQSVFNLKVFNSVPAFFMHDCIAFPKPGHQRCWRTMKNVTCSLWFLSPWSLSGCSLWKLPWNNRGPAADSPSLPCSIRQEIPRAQIP